MGPRNSGAPVLLLAKSGLAGLMKFVAEMQVCLLRLRIIEMVAVVAAVVPAAAICVAFAPAAFILAAFAHAVVILLVGIFLANVANLFWVVLCF